MKACTWLEGRRQPYREFAVALRGLQFGEGQPRHALIYCRNWLVKGELPMEYPTLFGITVIVLLTLTLIALLALLDAVLKLKDSYYRSISENAEDGYCWSKRCVGRNPRERLCNICMLCFSCCSCSNEDF